MNQFVINNLSVASGAGHSTFYVYDGSAYKTVTSMALIAEEKTNIISFDWDNVISWLSARKEAMPKYIIDIEQIAKQLYGQKKARQDLLPWSVWNILRAFYNEDTEKDDFKKTQKLYQGLADADEPERQRLFYRMLSAMYTCYEQQLKELNAKGEYDRFYHVERPIRVINLERTYKGITINTGSVSNWVSQLSHEVYKLRNRLQLEFDIVSPTDVKTVLSKIEDKALIREARELIEEKGYYFFLKDSKLRHPLIELLYQEKKSTTDLNALLSIGALNPTQQKIYPVYDSFGTITARTKVVTPNLQNLTRKFRSIVSADKKKELLYIDYAQFEAGILADDSKDVALINAYNTSYIYDSIGEKIQVEKYITDKVEQLKFCKSLFYKYSYGMDISNNIGILKDFKLEAHAPTLSKLIVDAFSSFTTLDAYRTAIKEKALTENKIGTRDGNYRYRLENEKNVSWAMSQRIQGTASLIIKRAIIKLRSIDNEIEFLIPMHDAALFQVPKETAKEKEDTIQRIFEEEFLKECPSLKVSAKFKNFCD
ncbi:DNA polymerase [Mucilaginibacter sp. KACC 22773]|uniref:DNA polymerase n=1 Tax=Mucilaginibacter sp. KACC 22773 TaxID=3025671 RepID=UPI0023672E99|nr:DNA polymerase [Mucilaginibacter sp. KACC 22773]WDF78965.1 DNA polymerase [Mucilaginibacter sp. KACC 22773]